MLVPGPLRPLASESSLGLGNRSNLCKSSTTTGGWGEKRFWRGEGAFETLCQIPPHPPPSHTHAWDGPLAHLLNTGAPVDKPPQGPPSADIMRQHPSYIGSCMPMPRGVMVSWCLLPGPAPAGAVACGPSQARAAQYRSKCNALLRSARAPPPPPHPQFALRSGPHGPGSPSRLCMGTRPMPSVVPKVINFLHGHTPMPSVLP